MLTGRPGSRVVVIHPYVQSYRRGLYDRLTKALAELDRQFVVVSNPPPPQLAARADAIEAEWTAPVPTRWVSVAGRDVAVRRLRALELHPDDLVIVEQAIKNVDTYPLMMAQRRGGPRIAMWGHGRTYSTSQAAPIRAFKHWLTRRADWFFAYTADGSEYVVGHGFPRDRVTVVNNTIDTDELRDWLSAVDDSDQYRRDHDLVAGRTALFLGGVDDRKGIDFLVESVRHAATMLPGFALLVGGTGSGLSSLRSATAQGLPIRTLGRLDGAERAQALMACDVLATPEWIGLVAVDSLVAGRPIVSTHHSSHSPERAYLTADHTAVFTDHDPRAYAEGLVALLRDSARLRRMQDACRDQSARYELSSMVQSFVEGIGEWESRRAR